MNFTVFTKKRLYDSSLSEQFENGVWTMQYSENGVCQQMHMYSLAQLQKQETYAFFNGHELSEIMDSGRDILGEEILKNGEPKYSDIKKCLPKLEKGTFAHFSGAVSWGGLIISTENGFVYPQSCGLNRRPDPLFKPNEEDDVLGNIKPTICLLDEVFPIVFSIHCNEKNVLELMYFVEPGDPDRDPIVWMRSKKYSKLDPQNYSLSYERISQSRDVPRIEMLETMFLEALGNTIGYWIAFDKIGAKFNIPEKELQQVVRGTQISCATTFSGDHPHYGHDLYGQEFHDNFPPNYIWSIQMNCIMGRDSWAKGIWEHMLNYALSDEGVFCYRQGEQEILGASASDYCSLLFLAWKYKAQLCYKNWNDEQWKKIIAMGDVVINSCKTFPEFDNRTLVCMCAEADTNTRIHVYLSNNLWAIRGFEALAKLLRFVDKANESARFEKMADKLRENITVLLENESILDKRFGLLPPFRLGYTAAPATLSVCKETFSPMGEDEFSEYQKQSYMRDQSKEQDLTENTFANYRYYLEMLSSMLLSDKQADAVVKMRETIGGEILGMTRFMDHLDDWPAIHYARYLLESGRIDKYIMLLYAHTCHHGRPDLKCYYEQATLNGGVILYDCIPSLLTIPIMTGWMFAYEPVGSDKLVLMAGVPVDWLRMGCSVEKLGTSSGKLNIEIRDCHIKIDFENAINTDTEIVWRLKDNLIEDNIVAGKEYIDSFYKNRLILKKGITRADIVIK